MSRVTTVTCDADQAGLDGTPAKSTRPCYQQYVEDGYQGSGWVHTEDGRDLCPRHSL